MIEPKSSDLAVRRAERQDGRGAGGGVGGERDDDALQVLVRAAGAKEHGGRAAEAEAADGEAGGDDGGQADEADGAGRGGALDSDSTTN